MRLAGQCGQCFRPFGQIARLVKNPAFERERLIGTDAVSVRTQRANRERLGFGQLDGQILKRPVAGEIPIFESALVDLGRDALSLQSRRREQSAATFAR